MKSTRLIKALTLIVVVCVMLFTLTGCVPVDATGEGTGSAAGGSISLIIMIVLMIAIFYFFTIRPENKKKKKLEEMRSSIAVGDMITSIGGITGRVVAVKGDTFVFETGDDRVRIEMAKWAISAKGKQTEEQK